jgi:hypothetical protein
VLSSDDFGHFVQSNVGTDNLYRFGFISGEAFSITSPPFIGCLSVASGQNKKDGSGPHPHTTPPAVP